MSDAPPVRCMICKEPVGAAYLRGPMRKKPICYVCRGKLRRQQSGPLWRRPR